MTSNTSPAHQPDPQTCAVASLPQLLIAHWLTRDRRLPFGHDHILDNLPSVNYAEIGLARHATLPNTLRFDARH
jgi:hypothetical protein